MEKKIVFVVREGLAVRNIEGQFTTFNGVGSVTAVLSGLKDTLGSIQTNSQGLSESFVTIYVPDMMNGLLSNSIGLYLRNGKTGSGKVIEQAELNLYTEVYNMLAERNFNVRLYNIKEHVKKEDAVTKTLIKNTWAALDREERKIMLAGKTQVAGQTVAASNEPSPELIAMQQQMAMMQQMMQGFMSMMGGAMPNMNMQGQMPVAPTTTQATAPVVTPDLGQPTTLNVDLNGTSDQPVAQEYEPEF